MKVSFKPWHVSTMIGLLLAISLITAGELLNRRWWPYINHDAPILWLNLAPGTLMLTMWFMAAVFPQDRRVIIVVGIVLTIAMSGCAGLMNVALSTTLHFAPGGL